MLERLQRIHLVAARQPCLNVCNEFRVGLEWMLSRFQIVFDVASKVYERPFKRDRKAVESICHPGDIVVKIGHCCCLCCSTKLIIPSTWRLQMAILPSSDSK